MEPLLDRILAVGFGIMSALSANEICLQRTERKLDPFLFALIGMIVYLAVGKILLFTSRNASRRKP